jgi:hypothetical protein
MKTMLTLESALRIPAHVSFSVIGEDAFLLNTRTNKYYGLQQVGARLWQLLTEGKSLPEAHQALLGEYDVAAGQLELDLLELLEDMQKNGLVEIVEA